MDTILYPTILFDWGDTVMKDDPASIVPMVEWKTVVAVQGIDSVLEYLQSSGRRIVLATSASISNESQIHAALARENLDKYFSHIYCFKNTGLPKGEEFYEHILADLNVPPSEVLMVGDHFEKDVQVPNSLAIFAVWFNPGSDETRSNDLHVTIHSMQKLRAFFESLDSETNHIQPHGIGL